MEVPLQFSSFVQQLGFRGCIAQQLWEGNIRSPQELAFTDINTIERIVDGSSLNMFKRILPVLSKGGFSITVAPDPFKCALEVVKKEGGQMAAAPVSTGITASDATGFYDENSRDPSTVISEGLASSGGNVPTHGQQHTRHVYGTKANVQISGGNFFQSNIMPTHEVKYDNQNAKLSVTTVEGKPKIVGKMDMNDAFFAGTKEFKLDKVDVKPVDPEQYENGSRDSKVYPVKNWGCSRALIINNVQFGPNVATREGACKDSTNLKSLLQQLGFKVDSYENLSEKEIHQCLKEFTSSRENALAPMFLVFVGSHGDRDQNKDWFVGVDNNRLCEADVISYFVEDSAPLIKREIPKMFFFQFCRQARNTSTASDSTVEIEEPRQFAFLGGETQHDADSFREKGDAQKWANMLFAFATAPGTKAFRDTSEGSWFVTALIKVFKDNARSEDLQSMLTMVNQEVMKKEAEENRERAVQLAEFRSYFTKKLMFYPGLH